MIDIEIGAVYDVHSMRKGRFMLRVTEVRPAGNNGDDQWITGIITHGTATAMLSENVRETGEKVDVRESLCHSLKKLYCAPTSTDNVTTITKAGSE